MASIEREYAKYIYLRQAVGICIMSQISEFEYPLLAQTCNICERLICTQSSPCPYDA